MLGPELSYMFDLGRLLFINVGIKHFQPVAIPQARPSFRRLVFISIDERQILLECVCVCVCGDVRGLVLTVMSPCVA